MKALVLAGQRPGGDALARALGVTHKALIEVGGMPMLCRVIGALRASRRFSTIAVQSDNTDILRSRLDLGDVLWLEAAHTPSLSVATAIDWLGFEILVTTADHALLTPEILTEFIDNSPSDCDLATGVVARSVIEQRFPKARRTYLRFRDDGYSGANLFLLRNDEARKAVEFWRLVEAERKRPWRIARALGPSLLFAYLFRLHSMRVAIAIAGKRLGIRTAGVALKAPLAAVDIDKLDDLRLAEDILAATD